MKNKFILERVVSCKHRAAGTRPARAQRGRESNRTRPILPLAPFPSHTTPRHRARHRPRSRRVTLLVRAATTTTAAIAFARTHTQRTKSPRLRDSAREGGKWRDLQQNERGKRRKTSGRRRIRRQRRGPGRGTPGVLACSIA